MSTPLQPSIPRIVLVGGGAGGLQLATRLGDTLGRSRKAAIVLVDCHLSHLWKPLLHEVAAGTLDSQDADIDYLAQARWHHFSFRLGRLDGLDRNAKKVFLAGVSDASGEQIAAASTLSYDCLVVAIGSVSNDFGVPGVKEHCHFLDSLDEADAFHAALFRKMLLTYAAPGKDAERQLSAAIVGAGATGVELAAELRSAARVFAAYGSDEQSAAADIRLTLIGSSPRAQRGYGHREAALSVRSSRCGPAASKRRTCSAAWTGLNIIPPTNCASGRPCRPSSISRKDQVRWWQYN